MQNTKRKRVAAGDKQYVEGLAKFGKKYNRYSQGQLTIALHNFGTSIYFTKRKQGLPSTTMKRVQKGTISGQPESVKRRRCSFKDRKALLQGKSYISLQKRWLPEKGNINSLQMSEKMSLPLKTIPKQCYKQFKIQLQFKVRNWMLLEKKQNG